MSREIAWSQGPQADFVGVRWWDEDFRARNRRRIPSLKNTAAVLAGQVDREFSKFAISR